MYLVANDSKRIKGMYGVGIDIDMAQVFKVVRTNACKAGEYALFKMRDGDHYKFSIFCGYITFNSVCDSFQMIRYRSQLEAVK